MEMWNFLNSMTIGSSSEFQRKEPISSTREQVIVQL